MSLNIYVPDDIRNVLLAANEASSSTAAHCPDGPVLQAYRDGYRAALITVALAFGLAPSAIAGRKEILEVETRTVEMLRE